MRQSIATASACDRCLARTWLLARLSGHLDPVRGRIEALLALPDGELIDAVAGGSRASVLEQLAALDIGALGRVAAAAGLELVCRCDPRFPVQLLALEAPPAVLHVAGGLDRLLERLSDQQAVAVVGARCASQYGLETARSLAQGVGCAGLPVISGMAIGIDSAAHAGALDAGGFTAAVLPGGADRAYPRGKRALHARIRSFGAAVSELPPGVAVRRWMFPARNRIIAALAAITIVVEAGEGSGALVTAAAARRLGRPVGAVPGRVSSRLAAGPHELLASGAELVRGPQDVLDALFGAGIRTAPARVRDELDPELERCLIAIGDGHDTIAALERVGLDADRGLAALSALELAGYVRRGAGGRYAVVS